MKKHTPGPWVVKESGEANVCTIMRTDERNWLAIVRQNGELSVATEAANAELMASAPDLLAERDRLREVNAGLIEAMQAIEARIDGVWDRPALLKYGPMFSDGTEDVARISRAALDIASLKMDGAVAVEEDAAKRNFASPAGG